MNSALDKLYNELLEQADNEPEEELTEAERAKRFLAEKQITIEKLKEVRFVIVLLNDVYLAAFHSRPEFIIYSRK